MCVCVSLKRWQAAGSVRRLPNVVLVSEHDDGPGVGGLQQAPDDLVKLPWSGFPGDLQGLGDAHAAWVFKQAQKEKQKQIRILYIPLVSFIILLSS